MGGKKLSRTLSRRASEIVYSAAVLVVLLSFAPAVALADDVPSSYKIEGVPLYQQIDAKGCGPVALQMVFDYFGEFVEQEEIYNAARAGGTTLPDMARAAQFSDMSTTVGERWPQYVVTGYTARSVGYAAFYFASAGEWMDDLKSVVAQGYPVAVLQNFYPDSDDPHYRVVVGYDEAREVFIVNDGWSREFKAPSGYEGSTSASSNPNAWDTDFPGMEMSYSDFELAWRCSTDTWGVPGLMYGAVMVAPWSVQMSVPSVSQPGEDIVVDVSVTYPCVGPFGTGTFPVFTASDVSVLLVVTDVDGDLVVETSVPIGTLPAGGACDASFTFVAPSCPGDLSLEVWATGMVSGYLEPWKDYPAYPYTDRIGGGAAAVIEVG